MEAYDRQVRPSFWFIISLLLSFATSVAHLGIEVLFWIEVDL